MSTSAQLTPTEENDHVQNAVVPDPAQRSGHVRRSGCGHAVVLAVFGGRAVAQQDKYTLKVPNGLAFSYFRGYEDWQVVAVSQTEELLKVMIANPTMIDAYRAGVPDPASDTFTPDGSGANCGYAGHTIVAGDRVHARAVSQLCGRPLYEVDHDLAIGAARCTGRLCRAWR